MNVSFSVGSSFHNFNIYCNFIVNQIKCPGLKRFRLFDKTNSFRFSMKRRVELRECIHFLLVVSSLEEGFAILQYTDECYTTTPSVSYKSLSMAKRSVTGVPLDRPTLVIFVVRHGMIYETAYSLTQPP